MFSEHDKENHHSGVDINDVGYLYILIFRDKGRTWMKVGKTVKPKERLAQYNQFPVKIFSNYEYLSERLYNLSKAERRLIDYVGSLNNTNKVPLKEEWFEFQYVGSGLNRNYTPRQIKSTILFIESLLDLYLEV